MWTNKMHTFFVSALCIAIVGKSAYSVLTEEELKNFLANEFEQLELEDCKRTTVAAWNSETDINNQEKQQIYVNLTLESAKLQKDLWRKYFKDLNPEDYKDEKIRRQVKDLRILGNAALSQGKLANLTTTMRNMGKIYSGAKICPYTNQNCDLSKNGLNLEPGIEAILAKSTDYDELVYVWKAWRDATGAKMKNLYKIYVELSNEAAVANKFKDRAEMWIDKYESETFVKDIDDLWTQVEPLYNELHKYVGRKLKEQYGDKLDISDGLIPAHIFGNMWAQYWGNLANLVKPFPNASKLDVDKALLSQNYTILKMFQTADHFYKSLGLLPNDISYNISAGAIIEKPKDGREVVCHASAWDFCDGENFRIKMCTEINLDYFITIHHEMGHIQYFRQYAKQPYTFRDGANPGFHEAIGDTIALSVSTPKHLEKIKLANNYNDSYESSINALMDMALSKVSFLPFGLLVDKWRWDVFNGTVSLNQWNSHWWEYRKKYQKVKPPVERSENDFDPGAKYHVATDTEYIAYFVAHILQFQFYRSLCIAAGEYNPDEKSIPLHKCDFYESKAAGELLKNGLSIGASQHWSEVLKLMTGQKNLDATALLEYFEPLYNFLKEKNKQL